MMMMIDPDEQWMEDCKWENEQAPFKARSLMQGERAKRMAMLEQKSKIRDEQAGCQSALSTPAWLRSGID